MKREVAMAWPRNVALCTKQLGQERALVAGCRLSKNVDFGTA